MYNLLVKAMFIAALAQLGISLSDFRNCYSQSCAQTFEKRSRDVLHIDWKPISVTYLSRLFTLSLLGVRTYFSSTLLGGILGGISYELHAVMVRPGMRSNDAKPITQQKKHAASDYSLRENSR